MGRRPFKTSTPMPNLPGDTVDDILSLLPAKSIGKFRCVSKYWYSLLNNNDFMKSRLKQSIESENLNCFSMKSKKIYMHITKPSSLLGNKNCHEYVKMDSPFTDLDLKNVKILGSCNGRVLIKSWDYDFLESLWLWDPCTNELNEALIPEDKSGVNFGDIYYKKKYGCTSYGVGYNSDTDDYTIVVETYYTDFSLYGRVSEIHVYSMASNSWKTLTNIFPYKILSRDAKEEVIFVCGAFHWKVRSLESQKTCIMSFNIHSENFKEVEVTPQVDWILSGGKLYDRTTVGVLGGCLCIVLIMFCFSSVGVWVMKNYHVKESWMKLFTAQPRLPIVGVGLPDFYVKLIWEFKNGEVLFVTTDGSGARNCCLVLYDPVSEKCTVTEIEHIVWDKWDIEAYVETSHLTCCTQQAS